MRRMAITSGIGLIIAVFLGTPYFFGHTDQSLSDELLTRTNQFFSGKSESINNSQQQVIASFNVEEKIYHGPFYWGADADGKNHFGFGRGYFVSIANPDETTEHWLRNQGFESNGDYWASRNIAVSLLGRIHATGNLPGVTYKSDDTLINWQGAQTKMALSPGLSNLRAEVSLRKLSYTKGNSELEIPKAHVDMKLRYKNGLWVGNSDLNIPEVSASSNQKAMFALNNLSLKGDSSLNGNLLNSLITLSADKAQIGSLNYAPFSYNLDIKNVDANAWLKLRDLTAQYDALMNADKLQYSAKLVHYHRGWFSSDAQMQISISRAKPTGLITRQLHSLAKQPELLLISSEITKTLPEIVNKGASFTLKPSDAAAAANMQKASIDASLTFPKTLQSQDLGQLIRQAESHIQINFMASTLKTLAEHRQANQDPNAADQMTQQLLASWVSAGYLKQDHEHYIFALNYSQGKLSVNGKTIGDAPGMTAALPAAVPTVVVPAVNETTGNVLPSATAKPVSAKP